MMVLLLTSHSKLFIFENHHRRIATAGAHDAAARMRGGPAHVKVPDGRTVLRPSRRGPKKKNLLQRQLALENIAFRQSKLALEVEWRQHLPMQNYVLNI